MDRKPAPPLDVQRRTAWIERAAADGGAEATLEFALASEEPVERWYGIETLSMDGVDLSRADGGLPLLVDHDTGDLVGVLENVRKDSDRVIRGTPRWSRSARAQEIAQDVADGIRTGVSIGYRVMEWKEEIKSGQPNKYTAMRWTLLEGSLVAIPADATVGVGRSAHDAATPVPATERVETPEVRMTAVATPAGGAPPAADHKAELDSFVKSITDPKIRAFADERVRMWKDYDVSLETAKREVYEKLVELYPVKAASRQEPDLTPRELKRFSVTRAINALIAGKRDGFEFEVTDEMARLQGRDAKGVMIPFAVLASGYETRANELVAGTAGVGGNLRFTEYAGFVEMLRNRVVGFKLGVQYLPGLQGNVAFAKQTGAHTFSWQSTEIANASNSAWTLAQVTATPKIGQAASYISRQLLAQAVESVENRVRNDIAKIHGIGIDAAILAGTGSSGQPTGIAGTSGIGDVAGGTNGAQPSYANVLELWSDVATANGEAATMKYLTHPLGVARLAQTQRFSSTDTPLWKFAGQPGEGTINEIPAMYSTQVPSAQTKGTSSDCYYIYFGDWSGATLCEWGSMEILVDPYSVGPSMVKLASIQMIDVAVTLAAGFSVMKDARP